MYPIKLLILLFHSAALLFHPVHVSIMNFDYSSKEKIAEVSVKVFPDDFELAFNHNYNIHLNLGSKEVNPEWQKYLNLYFDKVFSVRVNNKTKVSAAFKSYEIKEDGIMLYFTIPLKGKVKSLQIENTLLLDTFENQTNLVILSIDGKEKGYNLNFNNYKIDLKL